MKHDDLWNDMLRDTLPRGANTATLQAMCGESRRQRARRRTLRACGAVLLLATCTTVLLWPRAVPPAVIAITPALNEHRQLTDAELMSRLDEAGFGMIISSTNDTRRLLIVSHAGAVYTASHSFMSK